MKNKTKQEKENREIAWIFNKIGNTDEKNVATLCRKQIIFQIFM